jgi:hypothetical protein
MHDIESAIGELALLGAPDFLRNLASGAPVPGSLSIELQTPRLIYRAFAECPDLLPGNGRLVPLWETNGDSVTALLLGQPSQVIRYYFGDPAEEYEVVGSTIHDALQHVIIELIAESGIDESAVLSSALAAGIHEAASMVEAAVSVRSSE